jgi:hypothetical protein
MERVDSYVIKLDGLKKELMLQSMHYRFTLGKLSEIQEDVNYETASTILEKNNINSLVTLITNGLSQLESIVWE